MFVHQIFNQHPEDAICIREKGKSITYGQLKTNTEKYRCYFDQIGIKTGENVGLYCGNSAEFLYTYFAVVSLGAVIVPLNNALVKSEIEYIAKDAQMKHLITMNPLQIDSALRQVIISEFSQHLEDPTLKENQKDEEIHRETFKQDVVVIIYTSGTTGHPKGAMLTHQNLISNANSMVHALELTLADHLLCVLPMFHSFAWTCAVLAALKRGSTIVIMEAFIPNNVLKVIMEEKVSVVIGVPTMFSYYLMLGEKKHFESVRIFLSGGSSLPAEILEKFSVKFGKVILEGYGLSEASPVVTINPLDKIKPGSIGKVIDQVQVKIVDDKRGEVPVGSIGELAVKGTNVMKGYYNLPEATANAINKEWLYTGDVAYIDSEGYVFIVDRLTDVVIVGGMNVYPREIEEVLYKYEGILEAAVIGVPDELRGESVIAYIVVKEPMTYDPKALNAYLREHLAGFKIPRKIILKEALPKTSTGKILKKELKLSYNK